MALLGFAIAYGIGIIYGRYRRMHPIIMNGCLGYILINLFITLVITISSLFIEMEAGVKVAIFAALLVDILIFYGGFRYGFKKSLKAPMRNSEYFGWHTVQRPQIIESVSDAKEELGLDVNITHGMWEKYGLDKKYVEQWKQINDVIRPIMQDFSYADPKWEVLNDTSIVMVSSTADCNCTYSAYPLKMNPNSENLHRRGEISADDKTLSYELGDGDDDSWWTLQRPDGYFTITVKKGLVANVWK